MDQIELWRVFVRVVETGSFTRAAAALNHSQPTVTKAIGALEKRLQSRLLYRNTRGVRLTGAGQTLYDRLKTLLEEIEATERAVRGGAGELEGTLRISASVAFGRRVVAPLVLSFTARYPALRIELVCDDRYADLVAQGIDLAIRMGRLADSGYGAVPLGFNPWIALAAPSYLAGAPRLHRAEEAAGHACLVYSSTQGDDTWRFTDPAGETVRVPISARLKTNNLSALVAAAVSGLGVAVLPRYVAASALRAGALVPVLSGYSVPGQEMSAVFPSPRLVPPKVMAFVRHLQVNLSPEWWEMTGPLA